ncbi:eukaryotic translation initiation factor 3 subunit A-like isoform X2 [Gordionus sp. m RMFG-2023]|uniref:eukaryotic translation initiation factor 3 subunit A-like isoform X2 n=1 Tax=Gordionus sp. m RMFG-2023 TaxID=3053472 RepID=UPI0031FD6600
MPVYMHKPDNVLKRAQDVGKDDRALEALAALIKNKPHKIWQKTPEKILYDYFNKFLTLCVKLRKSDIAKEGLYHYRNICQQVNVSALESVFRNFLEYAEKRTFEALEDSKDKIIHVDDLDVIQSPEELLLSAVSGEDSLDRNNRLLLTPWVKFLWEAYRQCLDLLRNNNLVQPLYHEIAKKTFEFCQKYSRRTEFKKISENLRNHISLLQKQNNPSIAIDLNNYETQQMHLNTRFIQLDIAIQMELWQETFKVVQDIYGLMQITKKQVKTPVRVCYYEKLALVFWKAENNHLFHACALHRLYSLFRDNKKNFSQEDSHKKCTITLLATLSIPIPPSKNDIDKFYDNNDKNRKLAALLGLVTPPTRHSLIQDLIRFNIISNVPIELKNLFDWLEVDFHPLKLASRVSTCLDYIKEKHPELQQYIPFLKEVTLFKLLQQIAQVYKTIKFDRFCSIASFLLPQDIERFIVNVAKNNDIQVRLDHEKRLLSFGTDYTISEREDDNSDCPQLQALPTERIRAQLIFLAQTLDNGLSLLPLVHLQKNTEAQQLILIKRFQETATEDFHKVGQRLDVIDNRRKKLEDIQKDMIKEAKQNKLKLEEKEVIAKREQENKEKELSKMQERKMMEHTNYPNKSLATNINKGINDRDATTIYNINEAGDLKKTQNKINQDLIAKLKTQYKKVDHLARAIRQEEVVKLKTYTQDLMEQRKVNWEKLEILRIQNEEKSNALGLKEKDRLSRIKYDIISMVEQLKDVHGPAYQTALINFEQDLIDERAKRLKARADERKRERKARYEQRRNLEREEEERRTRYEEDKRSRYDEDKRSRFDEERSNRAPPNSLYQPPMRQQQNFDQPSNQKLHHMLFDIIYLIFF